MSSESRKMTRELILLLWLFVACNRAPSAQRIGAGENEPLRPLVLKNNQIENLLKRLANTPDVFVQGFQRDSTGSTLFINFFVTERKDGNYRSAIVNKDGIRIVSGFASVWYGDSGDPIFKCVDDRFIFLNGITVPRKVQGHADSLYMIGVLGSELILVRFPETRKWVLSKADDPRAALIELPTTLNPERAYASSNQIIVFGVARTGGAYMVKCLIYERTANGYSLYEETPLPWANLIYDMDTKSGEVLATGKLDLMHGYYSYNIQRKTKKNLGFDPGVTVLLKQSVIRRLEAALRNPAQLKKTTTGPGKGTAVN